MGSPLHVLAVGLGDDDAVRLAASLRASGFSPDVQRVIDVAEAQAGLDRAVDVVVLGPDVPAAAREGLVTTARSRRLATYVLGLDELVDPAGAPAQTTITPGPARLSTVLARRALTGKAGPGRDAGWVLELLSASRAEVYVVDAQTLRIRYANHEALRSTGHAREALQAMTLLDLAPGTEEASYRRSLEPLLTRERDAVDVTVEHQRADGTRYPIELHLRWLERDRAAVLVGVGQDLSHAREVERALARARLALDGVRDAVLVLSPAGVIESANEAATRVYRRPVEELIGLRPQDLAAPDHAARASLEPRARPADRGRDVLRTVHRRSDGALFEAEVVQHTGEAAGERLSVMVVRDVTDHRKVARALEEAGESLRTILHAAPDPVVLLDPAGLVTSWSRSAERLFGWSEAEVLAQPAPFVPQDREAEWQTLLKIVQEGNALGPIQVVRRRRDGARLDVLLSMSPLRGRDRRARGAVVVMSDVTDRTRADVERAHLIAALDLAPDEVYLVEPGTLQVQFANERAARACGMTPDAATVLTLLELEPGLTHDAFAARAGAALLPAAAPARYTAALRAPDGGLRHRAVELATVEHAGVRVHVLVAHDLPAAPDESAALLHTALQLAGLGVIELEADGGVAELDGGARRLLGLAADAPAPPSIVELARAARAPELLDASERLDREHEVHGSVHVAAPGAVHTVEVSALTAGDGRRVLVLTPGADEAGLVGALLEGLRRAAAGGPFAQVAQPTCGWLARALPARAVWVGGGGDEVALAGPDAAEVRGQVVAALTSSVEDPGRELGAAARAGEHVLVGLTAVDGGRLGWVGAVVEPGPASGPGSGPGADLERRDAAARALAGAAPALTSLLGVTRELEALRLRAAALDATGAPVIVADRDGRVRWSSQGAGHDLALDAAARHALARGEPVEARVERDGRPALRRVLPVRGAAGDVTHLVAVERALGAHELGPAASDPVTGLPTPAALEPGARFAAALALDVDGLRELSAVLGPSAADRLLARVAERVRASLGTDGVLVRGRGDVLIALLRDGARGQERARALLDLVRAHPFTTDGGALREVRVTVSGGLAVGDCRPADLLVAAEVALTRARAVGAGGLALSAAPAGEQALQRLAHEQALRAALARDDLEAAWTAQRDLTSGEVVAHVAGLRWRTEALGAVSGPALVSLAGGADPLGWAAALARAARQHPGAGPARLLLPLPCAPGLGAALAERLRAALDDAPGVELTAELHAPEPPLASDVAALRAGGLAVSVALLGRLDPAALGRLDLAGLVLPPSVVGHLLDDRGARAVAAAAGALARSAGWVLVADGLATERQRDAARDAGCAQGRGPLLA